MSFGLTSECQVRAQAKYDKEYTVQRSLKFNIKTDQDIIRWMWYQKSVQGSIKRLIREEIARKSNNSSTRQLGTLSPDP